MSNFSKRLRELRKSKDLSQQRLAHILGVSKSSVNMYERGEREPGLEMLEAMADFFNVDLDYLLGKTDVPNRLLQELLERATIDEEQNILKLGLASVGITPQEAREKIVLMGYRYLDDVDKDIIFHQIWDMLKSDKYKDIDFTL